MSPRAPTHLVEGRRVAPGEIARDDFTFHVVEVAAERRATARKRTRLRDGIIGERRHRAIVECRIADRSPDGARLLLDDAQVLPASFVLTDGAARTLYRATLVWQDGREAGVKLAEMA